MNTEDVINEKELVELLKRDDHNAFSKLYSQYKNDIFSKAKSITKNNEDAEELTNDTFLKVRKYISSFRGEASLKTWIFRIATNLSINKFKQAKRQHRNTTYSIDASAFADDESCTLADILPDNQMAPDALLESEDTMSNIQNTIKSLPKEYAEILELRFSHQLSYEEIAEKLNLSIGTVKSRIARARDALQEKCCKLS